MLVNIRMARSKEKENSNGLIKAAIKGSFSKTIFTDKESIHGLMVDVIKDNMKWIKSTAMEFTNGPMAEFMKVTGIMVNSMAKENIFCKMEL